MLRHIITDAIRTVINDDYIEYKLFYNLTDSYSKNRIFTIIDEISRCIANDKRTTMYNLSSYLQEGTNLSMDECNIKMLRIFAMLKKSEYSKYITVATSNTNIQFILDFKVEEMNDDINLGSYTLKAYDINKIQFNMFPGLMSIKYSMLSNSLGEKLLSIINNYSVSNENPLIRRTIENHREKMKCILRHYNQTNTYMDSVRNFTVNKEGNMTCLPKGKRSILVNNDEQGNVWSKDNRQQMKYGKAVRYIFTKPHLPIIPDKIIQDISQSLKSAYTFDAELKVVKGNDIEYYYNGSRYNRHENTESLQNSCMRHSNCEDFFSIYVNNPEKCKMLIASTDDGIIGRALLWITDNNTKLMDRIYGNEITISAFKKWALNNGYMHKLKQSYSNDTEWVTSTGEIVSRTYDITLDNSNNEYYPYMDTFKYAQGIHSKTIIISNDVDNEEYMLDSTDGGPNGGTLCVCGSRYHEDDVTYIEYGTVSSGYYHNDDVFYCDWNDYYYHRDDGTELLNGGTVYSQSDELCYLDYKDGYAHEDECMYSDFESEYYYTQDVEECLINGMVHRDKTHTLTVDDETYTVHETVNIDDLLHHLSPND